MTSLGLPNLVSVTIGTRIFKKKLKKRTKTNFFKIFTMFIVILRCFYVIHIKMYYQCRVPLSLFEIPVKPHQAPFKQYSNFFGTTLKHFLNFLETSFELLWNTFKTFWKHRSVHTPFNLSWNSFEGPSKHPWNSFETFLKLFLNFLKIPFKNP